jgi:hypothetical protein
MSTWPPSSSAASICDFLLARPLARVPSDFARQAARNSGARVAWGPPHARSFSRARQRGALGYPRAAPMTPPTFPETSTSPDYYLFDRLAEGLGDKAAVLLRRQRHTYAEVGEAPATVCSASSRTKASAAEQRVLIVLHDTPAFVWAFFATLHHGAVVAMGNPEAPSRIFGTSLNTPARPSVITIPRVAGAMRPALRRADTLRSLVLVPEVSTGGDVLDDVTVPADGRRARRHRR